MKKEEIFTKNHELGINGMEKNINEKANMYGAVAVVLLTLIFGVHKIINNIPHYDMSAILFAQLSIVSIYRFVKLRKKGFLILGVCFSLMTVLYVISYFKM